MQALKRDKEKSISTLNSKISHQIKGIERIKSDINKRNQFLINLKNKKLYIKDCLRNFYLQTLKNLKKIDKNNGEISEIIYSLWDLKYNVKHDDLPDILDNQSKVFILTYTEKLKNFKELCSDRVKN